MVELGEVGENRYPERKGGSSPLVAAETQARIPNSDGKKEKNVDFLLNHKRLTYKEYRPCIIHIGITLKCTVVLYTIFHS